MVYTAMRGLWVSVLVHWFTYYYSRKNNLTAKNAKELRRGRKRKKKEKKGEYKNYYLVIKTFYGNYQVFFIKNE